MIRWTVLLFVMMLGGCALLPSSSVSVATPEKPEFVPFAMNGRVSIDHLGKRHSAGLHWKHLAATDEILLLNPLGQTVARIYRDELAATLEADGEQYQAENVESLMQQVLSWHLPLNGLHHWILGMPDPEIPAQVERDEAGRIAVLHQNGWEVRYLGYEETLPSRMQLHREKLQMKLLIDEWDWGPQ